MKLFKRLTSAVLTATMLFSGSVFSTSIVSAAPSIAAGWNESLYAEWADSNPDSDSVVVGYKRSTDSEYQYLEGDDHTYLIRKAKTSGYGRVDIPGLPEGRYDIYIKASDGTEHTRTGIKVYGYDRSGYAHFGNTEGVGAYNDDGSKKDNAIVVYVTDENKDTVQVPGYENITTVNYASSTTGAVWTRGTEGIGNILNNNHKFIRKITGPTSATIQGIGTSTNVENCDNKALIFRFIGTVNVPKNLTPYNQKTNELGGSKGDNGNLAITKYAKNVTLEGIGDDAKIEGWGFTFSQTSTCPTDTGENFEVRNLTFDKYSEDALGFQGEGFDMPIRRVWVHNNVFYPGYCANPAESDKGEGDGSCDFKRGLYYTMAYNHYINCHKTNLVGSGTSDDQAYISLHHNWYQNVGSRQPLAANGNMHIYSTFFDGATSTSVDLRGKNAVRLEENYYSNCKSVHKSRNATCIAKSYNEQIVGGGKFETKGKRTEVSSPDEAVLTGSGYSFPDGTSIDNFDLNSTYFYTNNYFVTPAAEVPDYVRTYAGTLKAFPETESGEIIITVTSEGKAVTDAAVKANGLSFKNNGDGTYSATASLGAEYVITVSKEGYSNVEIKSDVLANDGDTFKASADLKVDYDGYAVVSLVGGSSNSPVKGASVVLQDGTVLEDQNDGTYKSANQIAVGTYKATITNTGDYIAPAQAQDVVVKTTDEATEIHLDMVQGDVSVTLTKDAEETKDFDPSGASVFVGTTKLDDAGNGVYTGKVDINTELKVSVNLRGWNVVSITPATLTASKDGVASATAVMKAKGDTLTWNYTDGTNTDNAFEITNLTDWKDASKNPLTYDGATLTKAIKFQSKSAIEFDAPSNGDLVIVCNDGNKTNSSVKVNGTLYPVTTGATKIPVTQGSVSITKGKNEIRIYLCQFVAGGAGDIDPDDPTDSTSASTSESTTETTTESTTEVSTNATPIELGEAQTSSGAGISVTHDDVNKVWTLTDSSTSLAAELNIPFASAVTSGKVVISGKATPSTASGKWAFVKVMGSNANGKYEVASLATDASKNITLRTNAFDGTTTTNTYAASSTAVEANKTYNYEFVIDLDAKTVTLKIDGVKYEGTTDATQLEGFASITSVSGSRNVTVTDPYVAKIEEGPKTLTDEIMWPVDVDLVEGNGLTAGETLIANAEENGPVTFTDGTDTYELENYVQGKKNPYNSEGVNPQGALTTDRIPVTGSFIKFAPESDGAFRIAVKTAAGKVTYITDETGTPITTIGSADATATTYDVISFNAKKGKTYYVYAGGSKMCVYYLGFTSGKVVVDPTTESTTEATTASESSTESTTESTTVSESTTEATTASESTTETTTESTTEATTVTPAEPVYGDANGSGKIEAADAAMLLQKVLKDTKTTLESVTDKFMSFLDVDNDGKLTATDVAHILQKSLDSKYVMPVEKK